MRDKQTDISRNIEKGQCNISEKYLGYTFLPNAFVIRCVLENDGGIGPCILFFVKNYEQFLSATFLFEAFVTLHSSN